MKWTEDKIQYLKDNYDKISKKELLVHFNVSDRAFEVKCGRLGLSLNAIKWEIITCLECYKEVKCLKTGKRRFCCTRCSKLYYNKISPPLPKTLEMKERLRQLALDRAKLNPSNKIRNNCKVCGNTCNKYESIYCSMKCKVLCSELRLNASERMKQRFIDNPELHPNRLCAGIEDSYPEKMLTDYLNEKGLVKDVDYIKQFKLGTYYIDFVFPTLELAIEVDGSYWHNPNSEREIKRQKFIEQEYRLIRFEAKRLVKKEYQEDINNIVLEILNQK